MDRQQMEQCLQQVAAYRASGQRSEEWAQAHGVKPRALASWCAHSRRWQAKIDGVPFEPVPARAAGGFVAAALPALAAACVRIEVQAGAARMELHWPLAHTRELAAWLREVGR
jgi:hypothetical protein